MRPSDWKRIENEPPQTGRFVFICTTRGEVVKAARRRDWSSKKLFWETVDKTPLAVAGRIVWYCKIRLPRGYSKEPE